MAHMRREYFSIEQFNDDLWMVLIDTHNAVYFTTTKLGVYIDNDNDMLRYFDAFALMLRN